MHLDYLKVMRSFNLPELVNDSTTPQFSNRNKPKAFNVQLRLGNLKTIQTQGDGPASSENQSSIRTVDQFLKGNVYS